MSFGTGSRVKSASRKVKQAIPTSSHSTYVESVLIMVMFNGLVITTTKYLIKHRKRNVLI